SEDRANDRDDKSQPPVNEPHHCPRGLTLGFVGIGAGIIGIEAVAQLLTGLEKRDKFFLDGDAVTSARIAPDSGISPLYRKSTEAAQLDPVVPRECRGDFVENRGDDALDITLVQVRIALGKTQDELRLGHGGPSLPMAVAILLTPSLPKGPRAVKISPGPKTLFFENRW